MMTMMTMIMMIMLRRSKKEGWKTIIEKCSSSSNIIKITKKRKTIIYNHITSTCMIRCRNMCTVTS